MLCCHHGRNFGSFALSQTILKFSKFYSISMAAILNYRENLKSILICYFYKTEIPTPCGRKSTFYEKCSKLDLSLSLSQTWIVAQDHLKIGIFYILISKDLRSLDVPIYPQTANCDISQPISFCHLFL